MTVELFVVQWQPGIGSKLTELVLDTRTVKAGGKVAAELIGEVDPARGEAVIAYGWAMAEALADGLATPRS